VITFDHVTHRFGDRLVVDDVSCTLGEARIAIIGANGSGKSTLARMINGLVLPDEGTVTVDGLDPAKHGRRVRERVSFLFSDPDAQIIMPTVGEDVEFSLRRSGLSRDERQHRVREALDLIGLAEYRDHPAHLLSSGQKQLLALTSVLATEPSILVADEPTTLLDLRNTRQFAELLNTLPQQIILVTHDLDLARDTDRVLVIADGRITADGHPAESIAFYRESVRAERAR
jgi:biotin transport system ATP-binding protein